MRKHLLIKTVRAYEVTERDRGFRILVDRLWPRGIKKDALAVDLWLKEIAPSSKLRQWFGHRPERWEEFRRRYFHELENAKAVAKLLEHARNKAILLIYGARDNEHNNAVALREYLLQLESQPTRRSRKATASE
jgi:uncharacterized protein YeaO (DUF488 family)